jgi:HK97 family phage portal protein
MANIWERIGSWFSSKRSPRGIGPFGTGDFNASAFLGDEFRKQRTPTKAELVAYWRNMGYTCSMMNANGVVSTPIKLYVATSTGEPTPKCARRRLSTKAQSAVHGAGTTFARIPGNAEIEEVTDHPLLELLYKPNPYMSWPFLTEVTSLYLDVVGNAFWHIGERTRLGIPKHIWILPGHQVYPWRTNYESTELIDFWYFASGRMIQKFPVKDVIHFKYPQLFEPYSLGFSPLQAVIEHVRATEKMLSHTLAALDNQARPDALVSPQEVMGAAEADRLERKINNKFRGAGFGGVMVAESALKLDPIGWSPADLAALEVYNVTGEQLALAFGVPLAMLTKETNMANLQASHVQHARFGIRPRVLLRDEVINHNLIPIYDDSGRLFVCSDNPVPEDEEMILKKRTAMVQAGVMTREEWRTAEGMDEEEWSKKPTLPTSQQVLDEDGNPMAKPMAPGLGGINGGKPGQRNPGNANGNSGLSGQEKPGSDSRGEGGGRDQDSERNGGAAATGDRQDQEKPEKDSKKKKKKKRKRGKKSLVEAAAGLLKAVHRGELDRGNALALLCVSYRIEMAEADALFPLPADDTKDKHPSLNGNGFTPDLRAGERIQAVLVPENLYSRADALAWVAAHGYKHDKCTEEDGYYRFRQFSRSKIAAEPRQVALSPARFGVIGLAGVRQPKKGSENPTAVAQAQGEAFAAQLEIDSGLQKNLEHQNTLEALKRLDAMPQVKDPEHDDEEDRVGVPFKRDLEPPYPRRTVLTDEQWWMQPIGVFDLSHLCATQQTVMRQRVRDLIMDPVVIEALDRGEDEHGQHRIARIVKVSNDGDLYIDGGHHHLTAAFLLGMTSAHGHFLDLANPTHTIEQVIEEARENPSERNSEEVAG